MIVNKPADWQAPGLPPPAKFCKYCKMPLVGGRKDRVYCDTACANEDQRRKWREKNPKSPLGELQNNTVAEVNEMRVAIDLLAKGCRVYRAAFQGMPCDMLIELLGDDQGGKHGWRTLRVEVTTGNRSTSGAITHPKRDAAQHDVLAVVLGDGTIVYKPEL